MGATKRSRVLWWINDGAVLRPPNCSWIPGGRGTEGCIPARLGAAECRSGDVSKSELESFDGLDNRREIMILFQHLGSDRRRARFLESLIPNSLKGFAGCPMTVRGNCDPIAAYYMLVGITNELGVSINEAARLLDQEVSQNYRRSSLRCT